MSTVHHLASGVDADRPRLKHSPDAKFPWKITAGNGYVALSDDQMRKLVTAYLNEARNHGP